MAQRVKTSMHISPRGIIRPAGLSDDIDAARRAQTHHSHSPPDGGASHHPRSPGRARAVHAVAAPPLAHLRAHNSVLPAEPRRASRVLQHRALQGRPRARAPALPVLRAAAPRPPARPRPRLPRQAARPQAPPRLDASRRLARIHQSAPPSPLSFGWFLHATRYDCTACSMVSTSSITWPAAPRGM